MILKKHNIGKFFVGEAWISCSTNIHSKDQHERKKLFDTIYNMKSNGAVYFFDNQYDFKKKRIFYGFISVFYAMDDSQYLCLHDYQTYRENNDGNFFCQNLIPIFELLPKIGYTRPVTINYFNALKLFNSLYHQAKFSYDKSLLSVHDIYFGNLHLCEKINPYRTNRQYANSLQLYILLANHISSHDSYGVMGNDGDEYHYGIHKCLFLDIHDGDMYNFNNYQIYSSNSLGKGNMFYGDSFFNKKIPLVEELKDNHIFLDKELVSVREVLKLQRKLNKK